MRVDARRPAAARGDFPRQPRHGGRGSTGGEYPREWVTEGRAWNEAYAWQAFLQYNAAFDVQVMNTCLEFLEPDWGSARTCRSA